ncbi:Predicted DNA-binding transcriptional regulator YafY, contains an HTH and WYL domains [Micromonospora phaseoli]|uniref:Predicted DNA-binding transcriptional regulator YafY, contains an HTH and WYL domains n=1 Tax=Micromonospora phaseoli TaxID=1144548 RepID=A0A1H6XVF6_9ACTN|nr:WYL domain-containing protein [Micromonospora phaseoli]PZW02275.1 putative DNA-binding transcriptional regulator YafY [Micromonospora phaseoli]GIJ75721.1 transcriptional regulator [Micromonospora phaseoli]SEJ28840.1 Predicted DNA-binding transcriptional regulator YafY, contains an HTH and WYL domains [Micromonospora phaseoli]
MRAARLISLLLLLQAREVMTAAELARELEVSERTIYRDVLALSAAGVPVYADRGRTGGYRLLGGYRTRLTGMSRDEAEALFLAGLPGPAGDMGLADAVAAAELKLLAALPPSLRDAPTRAGQRFHLDVPGWYRETAPPPWLAELAGAVWQDRVITLHYRRGEREVTRRTLPYGLVLKSGIWYLIGRVGDDFRTYRVDRVSAVEPDEETFDREPGFDLAGYWRAQAEAFLRGMLRAEVTLRLSPAGLRRLRHLAEIPFGYAEAVAAASEPDGQGWVTTRLPVESVEVAYTQLLGLGPEVEVLDPPELRALMAEATARTAALYADGQRVGGDGQR